jgi:hypothetical protein
MFKNWFKEEWKLLFIKGHYYSIEEYLKKSVVLATDKQM